MTTTAREGTSPAQRRPNMRKFVLGVAMLPIALWLVVAGGSVRAAVPPLGDNNIEASADPSAIGTAEANRFVATASGTIASLSIYLDSSSQATRFGLGLYSDSSGVPGNLLAQGTASATRGAWNAVNVTPITIAAGTAYWIARLSLQGGDLVTRVDRSTSDPDRTDTRSLASLPSAFSPGGSWPHRTSMYAATTAAPTGTPPASPSPTQVPTPSPTPSPTPTPTPLGSVGDQNVEGTADPSSLGMPEATRFAATASGTISSLSIYLDATNRATTIELGLYGDGGSAPGTLIARGALSGTRSGAWNTVAVGSTTIASGATYWIARLSTAGGDLVTRVNTAVPNPDRVDTRVLSSLPSTFSAGGSYPHVTSMYAGNAAASSALPTPTRTGTPAATPTPTATPTASGAFRCTEVLGFSQTGNWWSLQRQPNDAFESVVDGSRYQLREADGGAVWKWADAGFVGWSGNATSPCATGSLAPDRVVMDVTESFWIGDPCGSHAFDDCSAGSDTSVARVAQDIRNVVARIRGMRPSVRQIYLKPLVGGPPGGGQCYIRDSSGATHPIRGIQNSPLIAQAIAQVANGVDVLATPTWGVRDCGDFYDDGQYVGHLNPANDAKARAGQAIGSFFASRP